MSKKIINLKIEGMFCTSCAMLIDGDLEEIEGVKSAKTNYHKQSCAVEFDLDKVEIDQILQTVKKTGYQAKPAD